MNQSGYQRGYPSRRFVNNDDKSDENLPVEFVRITTENYNRDLDFTLSLGRTCHDIGAWLECVTQLRRINYAALCLFIIKFVKLRTINSA